MRVVHLNYWDILGGAAKGMFILHNELRNIGVDSWLIVAQKDSNDKYTIELYNDKQREERKNLEHVPERLYINKEPLMMNSNLLDSPQLLQIIKQLNPDIIHIHWQGHGFFSIEDLSKFNKPIVWTLRDWAMMTGGCHHPLLCDRFEEDCGKCPILQSTNPKDLTRQNLERKKKEFQNLNLTIVGISPYMSQQASKSFLFNKNIVTIHNNIDNEKYYPMEKKFAFDILNLKTSKQIVTIGANSLNDLHKGFEYFLQALNYIEKNIFVLIFGEIDESKLEKIPCNFKYLGYIKDDEFLRAIYSASDVFVAPSLYEPFGKTVAEAMHCGTPVVSFKGAGGPDFIIDHKQNGYLANKSDSKDLACGINFILNYKSYKKMSQNASSKIKKYFLKDKVAKEYNDLYKTIIGENYSISQKQELNLYKNLLKLPDIKLLYKNLLTYSQSQYIVYGYGSTGKFLDELLIDKILFFIDSDINKTDNKRVFHISSFPTIKSDIVVIVSLVDRFNEVSKELIKNNISNRIINLSDFLMENEL